VSEHAVSDPTAAEPGGSGGVAPETAAAASGTAPKATAPKATDASSSEDPVPQDAANQPPGYSGEIPPAGFPAEGNQGAGYGRPGYAQPGYAQPGYAQPGYAQPGYAQPSFPPPGSQPGHPPAGYPVPGYGAPGYPPPGHPSDRSRPVTPPPPAHRWGLGAYFVVEIVFLLASVAVGAIMGGRLSSSAGALVIALAVPTLLAAGVAILFTWRRGNGPRIDLGLQFSWRDVGIGLAFGFGGLLITIPASLLYVAIVGSETTSAVGAEFGGIRSGPWMAALIFVIVVFVAPLCEEIVYRGLLWGAVERLGARRWWALVITTVVFALAHFEFTRTPLLLVVAIPIALARLYTGKLAAGWVAHGINNLLPAVSLVLMLLGVLPGT